jgi:MOSC domain-containing protein YiiM
MVSEPRVVAVARGTSHGVGKAREPEITLIEGVGVEGDVHAGVTVKHRSRVRVDPTQPNLRQVHLIHSELHDELREIGLEIEASAMGENVTTRGIDLLALPSGARLTFGQGAVIEVTGLRNPCNQLDELAPGLMAATLSRGPDGQLIRKAGVMAVVVRGGAVREGDPIAIELPADEALPLEPV